MRRQCLIEGARGSQLVKDQDCLGFLPQSDLASNVNGIRGDTSGFDVEMIMSLSPYQSLKTCQ